MRTDNGTDVSGLTVEVFLKVLKNETGIRIGVGKVEDGMFQITCKAKPDMNVGDYHLVAHTLPNEIYKGSDSDPEIRIMTRTEVSLEAPLEAYVGEPVTFLGSLIDGADQAPIANATVSMVVDGEVVNVTTDGEGRVRISHTYETEGEKNVSLIMGGTDYFLGSNTTFGVAVSMRPPPQPSLMQILTTFPYNIIIIAAVAGVVVGAVVVMSKGKGRPFPAMTEEKGEEELEEIDLDAPLIYGDFKEGIVKLFNRFYLKNQRRFKEISDSLTPREFQNAMLKRIPREGASALDYLVTAFEIADYSTSRPTEEMFNKCVKAVEILEGLLTDE